MHSEGSRLYIHVIIDKEPPSFDNHVLTKVKTTVPNINTMEIDNFSDPETIRYVKRALGLGHRTVVMFDIRSQSDLGQLSSFLPTLVRNVRKIAILKNSSHLKLDQIFKQYKVNTELIENNETVVKFVKDLFS